MKRIKLALLVLLVFTTVGVSRTYAQQKVYTVGYLSFWTKDFKAEMTKLGYIEGQNVNYKVLDLANVAPADFGPAIQKQTQEIIATKPDILVTNTDSDAVPLTKQAGNTPIVYTISDDPVSTGAAKTLLHPGGTATGSVSNNPNNRRLQLMSEIKPGTKKVFFIYNTAYQDSDTRLHQVQASAEQLSIELVLAPITDPKSAGEALKHVPDGTDWIYITPFVFFDPTGDKALLDLSVSRHIPVSGYSDDIFQSWTTGYGPDLSVAAQQSADITDKILRGASPADLPIQIADNLLMVNLDTAQAMNLQIPESILRQASVIVHPGDFAKTPTPAAPAN